MYFRYFGMYEFVLPVSIADKLLTLCYFFMEPHFCLKIFIYNTYKDFNAYLETNIILKMSYVSFFFF